MKKPFSINFTQEEKNRYAFVAQELGISVEELFNLALLSALEDNDTGVYDVKVDDYMGAYRGTAGGHGASG